MDLEDKARHLGLCGIHLAGFGRRGARRGGDADEAFQQLAHAEVVHGRSEEDRCQLAPQIGVAVECVVNPFDQLDILPQLFGELRADVLVDHLRRKVRDFDRRGVGRELLVRCKEREPLLVEVVDPLERRAVRDREGQRPNPDMQLLLHLVQQVEGLLRGAVQLVDEDDHGRVAHPADIHQLARLRFDALGAVDHDDDRIHGRQRAIGVFGEVLVARRVEDIDLAPLVLEAHDGGGHRDAALAFDLHEVRRRAFLDLVALDGPPPRGWRRRTAAVSPSKWFFPRRGGR